MRKLLFAVVLVFCGSIKIHANGTSQIGDPNIIIDSANPFFNVLRQELSSRRTDVYGEYIPEYGLQVNSMVFLERDSSIRFRSFIENLTFLIKTFSPSVEGLDEDDWVSFSATVITSPIKYVTVRVQPNKPDTLEVWIGGKKQ